MLRRAVFDSRKASHELFVILDNPSAKLSSPTQGVAREIAQHLLWPGERLFAVDDPLGSAQACQELLEGSLVGKSGMGVEELQQAAVCACRV
jgi:hypothetical protein